MAESALRQLVPQSAEPFVRSYNPFNPAFRETMRASISDLLGGRAVGGTPTQRYRANIADMLTGAVEMAPGVGEAVGVTDTRQAIRSGDYGTAAMLGGATALGMVPVIGDAASRAIREGLDMSTAARMQRARDMGFDTDRVFYHGTTSDFDKFDLEKAGKNDSGWYGRGIYLTPDPDTASAYTQYQEYAQRTGADGANVLPLRVKIKNPYYWPEGRKAALNKEESEAITQELLAQGFDGVIVPNKYADPKFADMYEIVAFSPEQVRSVNAEFDPAKRGSANLLAGIMGGAVGLSALNQLVPRNEERQPD